MEITHRYAQTIVDRTMKILGYNINIMDSRGIIVGSGDKKRINTFHQGAAEVIRTGKPVEITSDMARNLEGVKPGVNLPIYLNDRIVGVVGITGEPAQVRPFGELLKVSVETMLQEAFLAEQFRAHQNARDLYMYDLIMGNFDDEELFKIRGAALGFDMNLPRVAVAIKVEDLNASNSYAGELILQKKREYLLNCIKTAFDNPQNIIGYSGSSSFTVFCVVGETDTRKIKRQVLGYVGRLESLLKKDRFRFRAGIGKFHQGLRGLKKSYSEAIRALLIGEKAGNPLSVLFVADVSLEILIDSIPEEVLENFLDNLLPGGQVLEVIKKPKFLQVLRAFFESDLNISTAARRLKISRNTVVNRLEKIKEITGLNARKLCDALKLKLLLLICELDK
ncbi:CdaR family transcriptional regulator [Thermosediminibacter oceani]|uniref:Transcriptional regulator, CdaR n=1 Tax=Thermosediminibacter oceani (strain ATCC BAA-1034 / DSM 16646 / JW/IW-1228P) TaxID=555079 RepID=D9S1Z3_THEOJ|nr:sugar diacid recognition domain-containing protein [Thermosediminibacter oceani]ADL07420.1 transcriptional regulator, CdaR [Thermosediminibacter oceani DSM 16646]